MSDERNFSLGKTVSENGVSADVEKINLRKLKLSPLVNPLVEPQKVHTRKRWVQSGQKEDLVNMSTGEITGMSVIRQVEEKDDAEFVKVFAEGVAASYDLTKTAQRVFQVVLDQYQRTPMSRGYADYVNLLWYEDGIEGRPIGLCAKTFQRGLKELLEKKFLAAKDGVAYWINPALFFKGDRVIFIKEYHRRKTASRVEQEKEKDEQLSNENQNAEAPFQDRLI